jgi:ferritin-like metal-binding protein YciE
MAAKKTAQNKSSVTRSNASRKRSSPKAAIGHHATARSSSARNKNAKTPAQRAEPKLQDLFVQELVEYVDAEEQTIRLIDVMDEATHSAALRNALVRTRDGVQRHLRSARRLLAAFEAVLGQESPSAFGAFHRMILEKAKLLGPSPGRDMFFITVLQKVQHYDMASLGTLAAWARALEASRAVRLLEDMLSDKKLADRHFTRLAEDCIAERGPSSRNGVIRAVSARSTTILLPPSPDHAIAEKHYESA